jgi:hypothetical protein
MKPTWIDSFFFLERMTSNVVKLLVEKKLYFIECIIRSESTHEGIFHFLKKMVLIGKTFAFHYSTYSQNTYSVGIDNSNNSNDDDNKITKSNRYCFWSVSVDISDKLAVTHTHNVKVSLELYIFLNFIIFLFLFVFSIQSIHFLKNFNLNNIIFLNTD